MSNEATKTAPHGKNCQIHRKHNGQFNDQNFDRMCVCGHRLGIHAGSTPGQDRPCHNEDEYGGGTGEPCECENYKRARKQ